MEDIKMGPLHWALLVILVLALGALSFTSGLPTAPMMPAVKNPEVVMPPTKVIESAPAPEAASAIPPAEGAPAATAPATPPAGASEDFH